MGMIFFRKPAFTFRDHAYSTSRPSFFTTGAQ
jgi:hypothetical protein